MICNYAWSFLGSIENARNSASQAVGFSLIPFSVPFMIQERSILLSTAAKYTKYRMLHGYGWVGH